MKVLKDNSLEPSVRMFDRCMVEGDHYDNPDIITKIDTILYNDIDCSDSNNLESELILETKKILDKNQKTLAYCRTGTRCINLWACANVFEADVDETIENATEAGYDLDHLRPLLISISSTAS